MNGIFKNILSGIVLMQLALMSQIEAGLINVFAMSVGPIAYPDPEQIAFELWNKTKNTVRVAVTKDRDPSLSEMIYEGEVGYHQIVPLTFDEVKPISDPTYLHFFDTEGHIEKTYKFAPNKKMLVRLKKEKVKTIFGPQTGALKGERGRTDTGIDLKGNVKESDITLIYDKQEPVIKKEKKIKKIKFKRNRPTVKSIISERAPTIGLARQESIFLTKILSRTDSSDALDQMLGFSEEQQETTELEN